MFRSIKVLSGICLLWLVLPAQASTWFVSPGGAGNGASWANAFGQLTSIAWSSVAAGDTICVAGGTYSGNITIGKSGSAASPITIKRATASDPVCGSGTAGWNGAFDAQVIINSDHNSGRQGFNFSPANYVIVDGMVASGMLISIGAGNQGCEFSSTASFDTCAHLEIVGPGPNFTYGSSP